MISPSSTKRKALATRLKHLSKRAHVETMDALFDEILAQIGDLKRVTCTLAGASSLCLQSQDRWVAKFKLPIAKSVLRVMCARLSVRCSEWAGKEVSVYGDDVEFELPANKLLCKIKFENTMAEHWFEISDASASAATPARSRKPKRSTRAAV